jgi:serine/threonine protein kinase
VHRDIKPDNIFVLSDAAVPDTVKVLDFGIAKLTDGSSNSKLTSTGAMLGTPAFMAPEQARGATDIDARVDIYAIGATMYQALTGRLPYDAPSMPALLFAIVEKEPTPIAELRPDIPADLVAVVVRAMAKDRTARFSSAEEMRAALSPWSGLASVLPHGPISVTAATVYSKPPSSGPPISQQPTPIAVSNTAPTTPTPVPAESSRRGLSPLAIIVFGVVAIVGIVMGSIVVLNRPHGESTIAATPTPTPNPSPNPTPPPTPSPSPSLNPSPNLNPTSPTPPSSQANRPAASAASVASVALVPLAAPTPGAKRYGGARGYTSGSNFSNCANCDWSAFRAALGQFDSEVSACFKRSEFEPPVHENPLYELRLTDGAYAVMRTVEGAPHLDQCLIGIVQRVKVTGKDGTPSGSFSISFRGECVDHMPGACK